MRPVDQPENNDGAPNPCTWRQSFLEQVNYYKYHHFSNIQGVVNFARITENDYLEIKEAVTHL